MNWKVVQNRMIHTQTDRSSDDDSDFWSDGDSDSEWD